MSKAKLDKVYRPKNSNFNENIIVVREGTSKVIKDLLKELGI
jgi:hypothetical protein